MPCDIYMLCGISSRFQLLSPSERQVAHVLLTRPPLIMRASSQSPLDLHVLGVPPAFVLSQDQTLYDSCIGTALAVDIDPWHHDLFRSQLPVWFFRLFWLLKVPNFFGFSRVLYFVVHCSIFKVPRCNLWAATFILYHISKFLSSELFVNVFELSFIPSSRLSAFLFLLFVIAAVWDSLFIISHFWAFVK